MFTRKGKVFCLLALAIPLALSCSNSRESRGEPTMVFMNDGSVFKGRVASVGEESVQIQTRYGSANLPRAEIEFVEGNGQEEGLLRRKEVVKIEANDDVVFTTPLFVKNKSEVNKKEHSFLVSGEVTRILNQDGTRLPFNQERGSGYSRCTVQFEEPLHPGEIRRLSVTSAIQGYAKQKGEIWEYRSAYVPEKEIFYTQAVTLPSGTYPVKMVPEVAERISEGSALTLVWRKRLKPQQKVVCQVEYRLGRDRPGNQR